MATLAISLLGQPRIELDGELIEPEFFGFRKACALLYYLAETGEPQSRAKLAGLLWPELPSGKALSNLRGRSGLLALKRFATFVQRQGSVTLAVLPQAGFTFDVRAFEQLAPQGEPTIEQLQQAAALYDGEFLAGFDAGDVSAEFYNWLITTRERLCSRAIDVFYRLMHYHSQWQEYDEAIGHAERLLAIEPWLEEAHRQMMLLLAYQGQRGKALVQYESCRRILREQLSAEPSPATQDVYNQIRENRLELPSAIPFLAPPRTPHFVGRKALLDNLVAQIEAAASSLSTSATSPLLLSLTGMGGIGKTTLATHIAHALRKRFPDGVLWANALESKPDDVINSWAQMYGYDFSGLNGLAARQVAWRGVTEKKSLLILVDDVWEAAQIRPILPSSPRCTVIMTTRNHDLANLINAQVIHVPELASAAGVELLRGILGEERVSAEIEAAQEISVMLENLPLALEIIGQRLRSRTGMTLADIVRYLKEINSRLDMLHLADRAVRATFELSWETLDSELRESLALLGVFEGRSLDADAFAAVIESQGWAARERLEDLAALSLIKLDEGQTASNRYRQHALLADFSLEKGQERPNFAAAQGRFAEHFYRFAQQHGEDFDKLRPNWHNFQHAITIAHQQNNWQTTYALTETLRSAWLARGRFDELTTSHKLAHEAALALEDTEKIAEGLYNIGLAATEQARYQEAQQHLTQSLNLFEKELDSVNGVIRSKLQLGRIALEEGKLDDAGNLLSDSHHLALQERDKASVATSAYRRARIAYRVGEYAVAEKLVFEALELFTADDNLSGQTKVLTLLARLQLVQGQSQDSDDVRGQYIEKARRHLDVAYELTLATNSQSERSIILLEYGWLYRLVGDVEKSAENFNQAHQLFVRMGDKKNEAQAIYRLSRLHEDNKQFKLALSKAYASQAIYEVLNDPYNLSNIKLHIGDLMASLEQVDQAINYWQASLQIAQDTGQTRFIPYLKERLARLQA